MERRLTMDCLKALERAILYIEHHLGEDIKVEDAAAAAGYSYYHFTRQFNALLAEKCGQLYRKRRIANPAPGTALYGQANP